MSETLDLHAALDMSALAQVLELDVLIQRVLTCGISHAGAERGALVLEVDGALTVVASGTAHTVTTATPLPLEQAVSILPLRVIEDVMRTGAGVVLDDAQHGEVGVRFGADPYLSSAGVRSLLCMPITEDSRTVGVLVLEHGVTPAWFTEPRTVLVRLLLAQAASALSNARLVAGLKRHDIQWRALLRSVPDIIALVGLDGRLEYMNHGLDPDSLIGIPTAELLVPEYREVWRKLFSEAVSTGKPREMEVGHQPQNASMSWYLARIIPIKFGSKVTKVATVSVDITMHKLAEAERAEFEAQLRQQQRLEAVGTLAAGIAHEINNPIQGIINYAELISDSPGSAELVSEFIMEITAESQRVAAIVRNLLAFSRQEFEQRMEVCDVAQLSRSTLLLIRSVLRKDNIDVGVEISDDLAKIQCRPQQIQQILMNVMVNARDALNEDGLERENKAIRLRVEPLPHGDDTWVRLSVWDNAGGIPDAVRLKIFDPFFTTKGRDQSTGLGLSVSHGIAAEHGGELWVDTEVGQGSTFYLDLPGVR